MSLTAKYSVELIAKDGQHFYTVNGSETYLPGVTGILGMISKPALVPWSAKESVGYVFKTLAKVKNYKLTDRFLERLHSRAKKQPNFAKETAARIGTHAHNLFDAAIKNGVNGVWGVTPFAMSFLYWVEKERLKIVGGDTKLASLTYGYGGSLDVLLQDDQGRYLIGDFKTGKNLYDSHALQVAAYSQAFKEQFGLDYMPQGVILRFVKYRPCYERREVRDIKDSFAGFKAALDLFHNSKLDQFHNRELVKPAKPKKEKTNGKVATAVR